DCDFAQGAITFNHDQQSQAAVYVFAASLIGVVLVTYALDLFAPVIPVPGRDIPHCVGSCLMVYAWPLGVFLNLPSQIGLQAGDLRGQLVAVKVQLGRWCRSRGRLLLMDRCLLW